jgi:dipeptidase D
MRLCPLWLCLCLLFPPGALARGGKGDSSRLTPAQMREIEREVQRLQEQMRKAGIYGAGPKGVPGKGGKPGDDKGKEPEPKPVNCKLPGLKRAAQFSEEALPNSPLGERYAQYVGTCGLGDVVVLTQQLVRFKTVSSEQPAAKNPGIAAMGSFLRKWAKTNGFGFRVVGKNDVFELSWGTGIPRLGLIFHGDVFPAAPREWKSNPFEARVVNGRLYGRGVLDDKGPLAMGLVSLAMAKEMGLKPQKGKVLIIIGNDEESDWKGMQEYARTEQLPTHAISMDASFPVVAAQSGFVFLNFEAPVEPQGAAVPGALLAVDVSAGDVPTQVPGSATLSLLPTPGTSIEQALSEVQSTLKAARKERPGLQAEVKAVPVVGIAGGGSRIVLSTQGRTAHSSTPEQGHNALWDLAAIADNLTLVDNGISEMLRMVARRFDGDHHGERLGFTEQDALMGRMISAPTLLRVKDGKVMLNVNLRRPRNEEGDEDFHQALDHAVAIINQEADGRVVEGPGRFAGAPHVADLSGPLVGTLMDIYRRHHGLRTELEPLSISGSTYARLFPRGVDFGPAQAGEPSTAHAPEESISLEHLGRSTQMLAEALHTLALSVNSR